MFVPLSGRIVAHAGDDRSNKLNAPLELRQFRRAKLPNRTGKSCDAARASSGENLPAFCGRFDVRQPSIA
jgi:hypothetical protein